MAIVFEDNTVMGPATHVLVIGVGQYPHLPGGASPLKADRDEGMRPLTSPPASARAFADWVIGQFNNPDRPLASVRLLLGEADLDYQPPPRGGIQAPAAQVTPATLNNMSEAALLWKQAGQTHRQNLMIFYYCGHGVSKGEECAIVANDYGGDPLRKLHGLADVPQFLVGMQDCAATDQCYFIDACRVTGEGLVEARNYGHPLVGREDAMTVGLAQCVYYSTLGGERAHGLVGQPSVYTGALLRALNGVGAANSTGDWRINTTRLLEALAHLMREFADADLPRVQVPQSGSQVTFELHRLEGTPEVPFLVGFAGHGPDPNPPAYLEEVAFRQDGGGIASYPPAAPPFPRSCDWKDRHFETWLTCGPTELELRKTGAAGVATSHYLQPPGMFLRGC